MESFHVSKKSSHYFHYLYKRIHREHQAEHMCLKLGAFFIVDQIMKQLLLPVEKYHFRTIQYECKKITNKRIISMHKVAACLFLLLLRLQYSMLRVVILLSTCSHAFLCNFSHLFLIFSFLLLLCSYSCYYCLPKQFETQG